MDPTVTSKAHKVTYTFGAAADSPACVRRQINLTLVLEVVQDRVKIFINCASTRLLSMGIMGLSVGRGGEGAIVGDGQVLQVDWYPALTRGIRGIDGRGVVDNTYATIRRGGVVLEIFKGIHGCEVRSEGKKSERAEALRRVLHPPCGCHVAIWHVDQLSQCQDASLHFTPDSPSGCHESDG